MCSKSLVRLAAVVLFSLVCTAGRVVAGPLACTQFAITLAGGVSTDFSEPLKNEDCVLVTITDVTWTNTANVRFLSGTNVSDKIVFGNDSLGRATICFESDNEPESGSFSQNCPEFANPNLMLMPQETNDTFSLYAFDPNGVADARIDLFSAPEGSMSGISDQLGVVPLLAVTGRALQITTPEPATLPLTVLACALAGLARFVHRRSANPNRRGLPSQLRSF